MGEWLLTGTWMVLARIPTGSPSPSSYLRTLTSSQHSHLLYMLALLLPRLYAQDQNYVYLGAGVRGTDTGISPESLVTSTSSRKEDQ